MREHLPLLKETLKFMVQQLRADDRLSLISFDHEVSESEMCSLGEVVYLYKLDMVLRLQCRNIVFNRLK